MATTYELAKSYFPRLWNKNRILALQKAGKLSKEEVDKILSKDTENK